MKIKRAVIDNFKGIRHLELDFSEPYSEEPRQLTAILGDNGSGKTSVLQALWFALTLGLDEHPHAYGALWEGLLLDRVSSLGETEVELTIDDEEAPDPRRRKFRSATHIRDGRVSRVSDATPHSDVIKEFERRLSSIIYFSQNRNIGLYDPKEGFKNRTIEQDWSTGVSNLRRALGDWWLAHVSPDAARDSRDYIKDFETAFSRIFPGTRFLGVQLNPAKVKGGDSSSGLDHYFLMEREGKKFDIAEMSSGEQAVFTILFEFVRNDIRHGIILIDELELHLHPPEQQALLAALPKIGPDCQFIITTHSPYIEGVIPDIYEIRLEGKKLCL